MGGGVLALGKRKKRHIGGGQAEQGYITELDPGKFWDHQKPASSSYLHVKGASVSKWDGKSESSAIDVDHI